jgi:hypothetical protein
LGLPVIVRAAEKDIDKQGHMQEHSGHKEVQQHDEQKGGEQHEQKVDSTDNGG